MLRRSLPAITAGVLFVSAALLLFAGIWRQGITEVVPQSTSNALGDPHPAEWGRITEGDTLVAAWLVQRNARTLLRSPWSLFEAELCAPDSTTLAFGEPMITLGAVAIPAWLATGSPIATYNLALLTLLVVSASAMYVLVISWTNSSVAATVAAILYAFNAERIADITHMFIYDTAWLAFGLYFTRRWLADGRWPYAIGLALSGVLQLGTSLYPILASLLLWIPIALWLLRAHGLRRMGVAQVGLVVLTVLGAAYFIFSPYLAMRGTTVSLQRTEQIFADWSWLTPHREAGIAWTTLMLAVVALLAPRGSSADSAPVGRGLCWSIALGALLAAAAATGPREPEIWARVWSGDPPFVWPNLYAALGSVLPGLDAVRVPARIGSGYHLGLCLLAGIGAAALLQRGSRYRRVLASLLLAAALIEATVQIAPLRPSEARGSLVHVAPAPEDLRLFETLDRMGNTGSLLELPIGSVDRLNLFRSPRRILLSAWHGRRTSACYTSFLPDDRKALVVDAADLPAADAMVRICARGFTTALVHLATPLGGRLADRFVEASMSARRGTFLLTFNRSMMAFGLCDENRGLTAP